MSRKTSLCKAVFLQAPRIYPCIPVQRVEASPTDNKLLFPGDIVTQIDGRRLDSKSIQEALQAAHLGQKELTLVIIPTSPFRQRRVIVSRLRETVLTDTLLPSKTTAAEIETEQEFEEAITPPE